MENKIKKALFKVNRLVNEERMNKNGLSLTQCAARVQDSNRDKSFNVNYEVYHAANKDHKLLHTPIFKMNTLQMIQVHELLTK